MKKATYSSRLKPKKCKQCGKEFKHPQKARVTCSTVCSSKWRRGHAKRRYNKLKKIDG